MAAMVAIYIKLLDISLGPLDRLSPKLAVVDNDEFLMLSKFHDPSSEIKVTKTYKNIHYLPYLRFTVLAKY